VLLGEQSPDPRFASVSARPKYSLLGTQRLPDIGVDGIPGKDAPRLDVPQVRADFLRSGEVEGVIAADCSECHERSGVVLSGIAIRSPGLISIANEKACANQLVTALSPASGLSVGPALIASRIASREPSAARSGIWIQPKVLTSCLRL
jgi:hypothetical protein